MVSQRYYKAQTGFSLIEILISLLILSIGLLGLGGLQLSSLKNTNNAHFRTVASLAATDLIDRMRANPLGVESNLYTANLGIEDCDVNLSKVCEAGVECAADELATYDLFRVNCGVSAGVYQTGGIQYDLPQASLAVGCTAAACTTGIEHSIRVSWNEPDDDDEDAGVQARSYDLSFIP
jgi:type IV pilus assembly protein PilV